MAYSKTDWTNNISPYINATNLDKMETGIDEAHDAIENTSTGHDHDGTDSKKVIAGNITNIPAGNIVATDAQAAITELDGQDTTHAADTSTHGVTGSILGTEDKDVANGVGGVDGSGYLMSPGHRLRLPRDGEDYFTIEERTSAENALVMHRDAANNYTAYVVRAATNNKIMLDEDKDVVNGIAGLDASSKQVPAQHYVSAPAAANSTGTAGQIAYDANYFYLCYATDTWARFALSW